MFSILQWPAKFAAAFVRTAYGYIIFLKVNNRKEESIGTF